MLSEPGAAKLRGIAVQVVLAQPELHIQGAEGIPARFPPLEPRHLKRFRLAQQLEPLQAFTQHRVIHLPGAVQPDKQPAFVVAGQDEWQFTNEGRYRGTGHDRTRSNVRTAIFYHTFCPLGRLKLRLRLSCHDAIRVYLPARWSDGLLAADFRCVQAMVAEAADRADTLARAHGIGRHSPDAATLAQAQAANII